MQPGGSYMERTGVLRSITLNDELICSSKVIFATLDCEGKMKEMQIVRELLDPLQQTEFDQFWENAKNSGEDTLVGKEVTVIRSNNFETLSLSV